MGGGGSKTTNSTTTVQLPAWVDSASQSNYQFAQNVANQPYQPYTGETVAGFSPTQWDAFNYALNNIGAYQGVYDNSIGLAADAATSSTPYVNANYAAPSIYAPLTNGMYSASAINAPQANLNYSAQQIAPTMADTSFAFTPITSRDVNTSYGGGWSPIEQQRIEFGYTPDRVSAMSFADANVNEYMNPYLSQVENYALQNLQAGTQQGLNKIGDQAATAGAFGGSRQGVQEGVLMGDAAKRAGELSSNIRASGYAQALQQITADQNRALQAGISNQSAGLQGAQMGLQAGIANLEAALQAQRLDRETSLQMASLQQRGELANQAAAMQAALANQAAGMDLNRLNQSSQFANQQAALQAALANQAAGMDLNRLNMQGQFSNISNMLQAALANQSTGMDLNRLDLQGQLANQQTLMQAALANQATGMDLNRLNLQGQLANQGVTQTDLSRQLQSALGMAGLADQGTSALGTDIARMLSIGGMQQQQQQQYLTDQYNRFTEARDYPLEQLNILLSALGMSPYGRTQTTNSTQSGGGADIGGILGGAGSMMSGLKAISTLIPWSDESMKTDISKVGKDKETGLDVYSYRYKGDPKTYPKVVGLMADDIEKKMPDQVTEFAGKKAVKFNPTVSKDRIIKTKKKA